MLAALFAGRQDSAVHLRFDDFGVDETQIWMRLTEKGTHNIAVRRVVWLPLHQAPVRGSPSALPRIAALARAYLAARAKLLAGEPAPEYLLQLPREPRPLTRHMEAWVDESLSACGICAPSGFAYPGHSIRSAGASIMAAIGVPRYLYTWLGGWARGSTTVEKHYLDPTVLPIPAAYALYGWALSRGFESDAPVSGTTSTLPDPLLEEQDF